MTPRLWGQNRKFFTTPSSRYSQKRLEHKENQTKYRKMTRKPRSHVRILVYRTWAILCLGTIAGKDTVYFKDSFIRTPPQGSPYHLYAWISIRKKINLPKTRGMRYPSWIKMIPIPRDTQDSLSNRFM